MTQTQEKAEMTTSSGTESEGLSSRDWATTVGWRDEASGFKSPYGPGAGVKGMCRWLQLRRGYGQPTSTRSLRDGS